MLDMKIKDYAATCVVIELWFVDRYVGSLRVARIQRVHDRTKAGGLADMVFLYDRTNQYVGVLNGVVREFVREPAPPHGAEGGPDGC